MILYFFRLDLIYVQCKIICIAIVIININAVHSWIVVRKCLTEINTLPLASYPLGNTSQFNRPVMLNKIKRIKDKTLTVQSLTALLLFINFYLRIKGWEVSWLSSYDYWSQFNKSANSPLLLLKIRNFILESCILKNCRCIAEFECRIILPRVEIS